MSAPSDANDAFAERLLQVIDEGRRVATYKLALLLALIDACAAESDASGRAPATLHTRTITRYVTRIYLPQVRSYLALDQRELELRQLTNPGKGATVLSAVLRLHLIGEARRLRTFDQLERVVPDEVDAALDTVEHTFARYPLLRLQTVGKESHPFLYEVDWTESITLARLHGEGGGLVRFLPGAGDRLLRLAPLLRPLIELHWVRMVAEINELATEESHLRAHLFGTSRSSFPSALRSGLAELQDGACFYCGDRLPARSEVDHVVPWSRWPNDAIENLVLADRCNGQKRDHLVALPHVDRWARRLVVSTDELGAIAASAGWESDARRSLALARSCYAQVPAGTPLWLRADEFTDDDPELIRARLADVVV